MLKFEDPQALDELMRVPCLAFALPVRAPCTEQGGVPPARWPTLMEGDGGKLVHALQVSLGVAGFHCNEDEMRWWMFDTTTVNALKTFQVRGRGGGQQKRVPWPGRVGGGGRKGTGSKLLPAVV